MSENNKENNKNIKREHSSFYPPKNEDKKPQKPGLPGQQKGQSPNSNAADKSSAENRKVDDKSSTERKNSFNVDKKSSLKEGELRSSINVDKKPSLKVPVINMFPQEKNKKDAGLKNYPTGPSKKVLEKIQKSKTELERNNKSLDQNSQSTSSRESKSYFASKHIKTISEKTSSQYLERARLLVNRYKREQNIPLEVNDLDPKEFVIWLLSLKPTVKASTWRVYRQAAYHMLEGIPEDIDDAIHLLDKDVTENDQKAGKRENWEGKVQRGEHKTSSMKEKKFPKQDFEKVLAFLQYASRSKMAPVLGDWLIATIHTGLRPIEWRATSIERFMDPQSNREHIWLYVINAKATNMRANGVVRTIDISDIPRKVLTHIERMSENGLKWYGEGRFDSVQSQIGQLLYSINERIFPKKKKHYALYSCRHQFIANMKEIFSPEEVSALSGHAVTKTAVQNYGKKRSSWGPAILQKHAKPIQSEVATVRKTAEFYNDRMEKLKQAGVIHGNNDPEFPV
jgi:hypothetical protein